MLLAHESGERLGIALVGCGNHAYRSLVPCLPYLPVKPVMCCDLNLERARTYARWFGFDQACASLDEALAHPDVQAVILSVGARWHPELTCQALAAGRHVWLEKPPARRTAEIDRMIAAREAAGRQVVVGFKKMFMPAVKRMKQVLEAGHFGPLRTIAGRFPMDVPPGGAAVLEEPQETNWLNNGVHPLSLLVHLGGDPIAVTVHRTPRGGGFCVVEFASGALASLHLALGHSQSGAMERYECVCERGHMVLENNTRLTIHRPGYPFDYRQGVDFAAGGDDVAALVFEPQCTLSTMENKTFVLQGFLAELDHFVTAVLAGEATSLGTLEQARAIMACYEAALVSEGQRIAL